MIKQSTVRMIIDTAMTLVSLMMIGGNYFFPWTGVHEILGVSLFVLWAAHIALNRRWYGSVLKGAYRSLRIIQTAVNCGILVCALFLMISGIMLSQHVFAFLGIGFGANFARIAHMLASHWYFLFMSLHIGLHAGMISRQIAAKHKRLVDAQQKAGDGAQQEGGIQKTPAAADKNRHGLKRLRFMHCLPLSALTGFMRLFRAVYGATSSCSSSSFFSIWKKAVPSSLRTTSQLSYSLQRRRITGQNW